MGAHSQYITRDAATTSVAVSNLSFVSWTPTGCGALGPNASLRTSDIGLCLVATYDMAVGTQLDLSWTLDGAVVCDYSWATSEELIRGDLLHLCEPTIAFGSGTYALTIQHNGQTVGAHSQYITRDAVTVRGISFLARPDIPGCARSRGPLGPANLNTTDAGLCLVATYDAPLATELAFSWTLDGAVLCTSSAVLSDAVLRGEAFYVCKPTSNFGTGTYAVTIRHNGQIVGSHSQYITRDPVSVSNMAFHRRVSGPYCLVSAPALGPGSNLWASDTGLWGSDLGLCLVATYDMAVGTELRFAWTLDGAVLCDDLWATTEEVIRGEIFLRCVPTVAFGSGTYALTIQHNGQIVGSHRQYITRNATRLSASVSNLSFVANTVLYCDVSRPLGRGSNLWASDLGLCLVGTYNGPAEGLLRFVWTLDGVVLCDSAGTVDDERIREVNNRVRSLSSCEPTTAFGSGTYTVTGTYNGQTVGSYSQYITRG